MFFLTFAASFSRWQAGRENGGQTPPPISAGGFSDHPSSDLTVPSEPGGQGAGINYRVLAFSALFMETVEQFLLLFKDTNDSFQNAKKA